MSKTGKPGFEVLTAVVMKSSIFWDNAVESQSYSEMHFEK
jgi:hypothetical protein